MTLQIGPELAPPRSRLKETRRAPSRWGDFPPPPPVRSATRVEPLESSRLEQVKKGLMDKSIIFDLKSENVVDCATEEMVES